MNNFLMENIEIDKIRRIHKQRVVDHAIRIYGEGDYSFNQKEYLVGKLLSGMELNDLVILIKNKNNIPSSVNELIEIDSLDYGRGSLRSVNGTLSFVVGNSKKIKVRIKNESNFIWDSDDNFPIYLCYHWYFENGDIYIFDGLPSILPHAIQPGEVVELSLVVNAPHKEGNYLLELSMLKDRKFWFEECGLLTNRLPVQVRLHQLSPVGAYFYEILLN